jgi:alkylated DNA repair dioxygenase AlkB
MAKGQRLSACVPNDIPQTWETPAHWPTPLSDPARCAQRGFSAKIEGHDHTDDARPVRRSSTREARAAGPRRLRAPRLRPALRRRTAAGHRHARATRAVPPPRHAGRLHHVGRAHQLRRAGLDQRPPRLPLQRHRPRQRPALAAHARAFARLACEAASAAGFDGFAPDACLVNRYAPGARLSLHQDKDEHDYGAPIVSVSLGMPAVFLFGGLARGTRPRACRWRMATWWSGAAKTACATTACCR